MGRLIDGEMNRWLYRADGYMGRLLDEQTDIWVDK